MDEIGARRLSILRSHLRDIDSGGSSSSFGQVSSDFSLNCASKSRSDEGSEERDCVFCKIIRGDSPAFKIVRATGVYSLNASKLEIAPCELEIGTKLLLDWSCSSHSLIIPKHHFSSLKSTPPSMDNNLVKELVEIIHSFNLLVNTGEAAGQVIFHTHLHIIPRKARDRLWTSKISHSRAITKLRAFKITVSHRLRAYDRRCCKGYYPPSYNPSMQKPSESLSDGLQNMQISRPPSPPSGALGSSIGQPPPFGPSTHMPTTSLTSFPPSRPPSSFTSFPPSDPPSNMPSFPPTGAPSSTLRSMPPSVPSPTSSIGASPVPSSPFSTTSPISQPGPPSSALPRAHPPTNLAPRPAPSQNFPVGRPLGPPFSQPPPFGSRPPPTAFASAPTMPSLLPPSSAQGPSSNGPSMLARGTLPSPEFVSTAHAQYPPSGHPPLAAPNAHFPPFGSSQTAVGRGPAGQTIRPFLGSPPLGAPPNQPSQPPPLALGANQAMPTSSASPYSSQVGQLQSGQGLVPMTGSMQPPRMYGMPAPLPNQYTVSPGMGRLPISGAPTTVPSKIDPQQMPRPSPSSSAIIFETRQGGEANSPPAATSDYIVKDTGNCSPRYMRCTINQIPCTGDLLSTSSMQLALMVQPLALPHPSEEPIQVVDFGESGPVRCSRCKGFTDETPRDYHCNLGPDGRRRDADERAELCRGTVEFVATKEYMVRDPMPAVFFFLIDVSMNAVQTGATAAACSAISQAIADLPPLMLIVPDVQDVYTPLQTDVIVQLSECRQHLEQLLENIPTMFQSNRVAESAFGAASKAAFLAMKSTGGKLYVFQSGNLAFSWFGALSAREADGRVNASAGEKEVQKLLQPADKTLKTMAIEFAEHQVCVDIFITCQTYVDIASISVVPRTTGGQVYYYYPFSAVADSGKLYNDLRWNITRPQGFEAVMRVRCSQGLQVQEYYGSFCKRIPTDVDLPAIDCDKTIMVTFKHDDKFQEGAECGFQCALLYTTVYGQRRIRVTTLSLTCTAILSNLFRSADLDAQFACASKLAANDIPINPLIQVQEKTTDQCVNILYAYRKFCAAVSSSGQLILPEALKLLPLYTLALTKSIGLQNDGRLDDRSYWISRLTSLPVPLIVPLVHPRMLAIHKLLSEKGDESITLPDVPLSSEHVTDDGIFFMENGEDGLFYVGKEVNPETVQQLFGVNSVEEVPTQDLGSGSFLGSVGGSSGLGLMDELLSKASTFLQFVLQQFGNELSKKLNNLINEIRRQRCSYLRLRFCKRGEPSGMLFFSRLIEDKNPGSLSYVEFLVHVHRQIQGKMA
ncbi:hypothetical protein Syun_005795 [Stephania yunnanensis]|uniref:HIT domain-containing protein n=1 Tax=Stephania yunnanensis TaxID=152371 RepID=A0AAP0KX41_9MAGN